MDKDKIESLLADSFVSTFSKKHFADAVLSVIEQDDFNETSLEFGMKILGALLANKKTDSFRYFFGNYEFNSLDNQSRSILILKIVHKIGEIGLFTDSDTIKHTAEMLKELFSAICPEIMQAHNKMPEKLDNNILHLNYEKAISQHVKGVVFFREVMIGPGSRKHEFGYRIATGLASQGWQVYLENMNKLPEFTASELLDFALVDIGFFWEKPIGYIANTLIRIKKYFRKLILIEPDPWGNNSHDAILELQWLFDYFWGFTSHWNIEDLPGFKGMVIKFPNVSGFDHLRDISSADIDWRTCTFGFTGSIEQYNLNRIYWFLEALQRNMPIRFTITTPRSDDGLDHCTSLDAYARQLASSAVALNFVTRPDGSRILTGRSIEAISLNRLLLQEYCPPFNSYFIEGEHFIEFKTCDELANAIDFLTVHPATARKICNDGHAFYHAHYSCRKLVEHLQTYL